MRLAVISDIHDNIWALADVLRALPDCEAMLCLGDLCAPFTIAEIRKGFAGPVHVVWGNNDGDKLMVSQVVAGAGDMHLHGDFAELEIGGRSIALTHYPQLASALSGSGRYDLVCYGHDHTRNVQRAGRTLLLNPGEVMGRLGPSSCAVYDTDTGEAQIIEVRR